MRSIYQQVPVSICIHVRSEYAYSRRLFGYSSQDVKKVMSSTLTKFDLVSSPIVLRRVASRTPKRAAHSKIVKSSITTGSPTCSFDSH
jgi:hypothetical protein